jgi:hypothetical protein
VAATSGAAATTASDRAPLRAQEPWQARQMRHPLSLASIVYASSPDELALFQPEAAGGHLTLPEVRECFPMGLVTHEEWRHREQCYRCAAARPAAPRRRRPRCRPRCLQRRRPGERQ